MSIGTRISSVIGIEPAQPPGEIGRLFVTVRVPGNSSPGIPAALLALPAGPPAVFWAAPARYKMRNLERKARCMNWEALGALGEIAGAAAVIVTLAYLSVQIRQNTKASRVAAVQAASENSSRFSELIAGDTALGEVFWH